MKAMSHHLLRISALLLLSLSLSLPLLANAFTPSQTKRTKTTTTACFKKTISINNHYYASVPFLSAANSPLFAVPNFQNTAKQPKLSRRKRIIQWSKQFKTKTKRALAILMFALALWRSNPTVSVANSVRDSSPTTITTTNIYSSTPSRSAVATAVNTASNKAIKKSSAATKNKKHSTTVATKRKKQLIKKETTAPKTVKNKKSSAAAKSKIEDKLVDQITSANPLVQSAFVVALCGVIFLIARKYIFQNTSILGDDDDDDDNHSKNVSNSNSIKNSNNNNNVDMKAKGEKLLQTVLQADQESKLKQAQAQNAELMRQAKLKWEQSELLLNERLARLNNQMEESQSQAKKLVQDVLLKQKKAQGELNLEKVNIQQKQAQDEQQYNNKKSKKKKRYMQDVDAYNANLNAPMPWKNSKIDNDNSSKSTTNMANVLEQESPTNKNEEDTSTPPPPQPSVPSPEAVSEPLLESKGEEHPPTDPLPVEEPKEQEPIVEEVVAFVNGAELTITEQEVVPTPDPVKEDTLPEPAAAIPEEQSPESKSEVVQPKIEDLPSQEPVAKSETVLQDMPTNELTVSNSDSDETKTKIQTPEPTAEIVQSPIQQPSPTKAEGEEVAEGSKDIVSDVDTKKEDTMTKIDTTETTPPSSNDKDVQKEDPTTITNNNDESAATTETKQDEPELPSALSDDLSAKYEAIEDLSERAFQILLDLGMVNRTTTKD